MTDQHRTDRRTVLRVAAAALPVALAGCSGSTGEDGGTATPASTPTRTDGSGDGGGDGDSDGGDGSDDGSGSDDGDSPIEDWMAGVSNYDSVVDRTGNAEVAVTVGSEANGGHFGYDPAAVRVDPGTTVVWEWTGEGGAHNVVDRDGDYESELVTDAGHTFSHTFESEGASLYYCKPHRSLNMKGAVVVG